MGKLEVQVDVHDLAELRLPGRGKRKKKRLVFRADGDPVGEKGPPERGAGLASGVNNQLREAESRRNHFSYGAHQGLFAGQVLVAAAEIVES